jgi:HK97 family phage major capsid protein
MTMTKYASPTGGFKSLGDFLLSTRRACLGQSQVDSRLIKGTAGELDSLDDAYGGFLVPEAWSAEIMTVALEDAIVRPRAVVIPTKVDTLHVRVLVDSDRSAAIFGGVTFTLMTQKGAISASGVISNQRVGDLSLTIHKLVGGAYVSNELMADVDGFGDYMKTTFGRAIAHVEVYLYLRGSGQDMPQGIVSAPALIKPNRSTTNLISFEDIGLMARRLLPDSWKRAVWLLSPEALNSLINLPRKTSTSGVNHLDIGNAKLLGRPWIVTEKLPALGTIGDIVLADFAHYVIADRDMTIEASQHLPGSGGSGFLTDETFWRIRLRVDGQPILNSPIIPTNGSSSYTVSPFVALGPATS